MNTHLAPEMPDNFVTYRDVGEGRKPGAVSFEILGNCSCIALPTPILGLVANSQLLAANSTLLSNISGTICYVMNRSELPQKRGQTHPPAFRFKPQTEFQTYSSKIALFGLASAQ